MLMVGWPNEGVFIDGKQTNQDAKDGKWWVKNSIVAGASTKIDTTKSVTGFDINTWFTTNSNQYFTNNSGAGLSGLVSFQELNALPLLTSPALIAGTTPPNDGFFDATATYAGAFGTEDWTAGWSRIHMSHVTSVEENIIKEIPSSFNLSQNYPNPFNPTTNIKFNLPQAGNVRLTIYNIIGQEVAQLVNGYREAGSYTVNWNASNLSSGIYIYRLEANSNIITKKMALLK